MAAVVVGLDAVAAEDVVLRVDAGHPARVALQLLLRRRLSRCNRKRGREKAMTYFRHVLAACRRLLCGLRALKTSEWDTKVTYDLGFGCWMSYMEVPLMG